jgi:hypothetical protein
MANPNLTRIHQKIFSENAANNGQFGSLQAGTMVENPNIATLQALPAYQEGWSDAVISGEELPSLEEFNGLHKIETEQLQYLLNKGIPEYSADAEYYIGDIQREVGGTKLYKSITDNNIGNALTDTLNWQELGDLADLIGLNQATTTDSGFSLLPDQITIENDSGDLDHDILFNAGNFDFDDGSGQAVLSSNLIKQIDAAWVAGNNQGGLDTGTVAINTWYYCYTISNDDGSIVDCLFSASPTSPTLPAGYTKKKRVRNGFFKTNSSSNIKPFYQSENAYRFTGILGDTLLFSQPSQFGATGTVANAFPSVPIQAFCTMYLGTVGAGLSSLTIWGNLTITVIDENGGSSIATNNGFATRGTGTVLANDGVLSYRNWLAGGGVNGISSYLISINEIE